LGEIAEGRQLRAAADGRAVHHDEHGLAELEHVSEDLVEGVNHLKDALLGIFAEINALGENLLRGIEDDQLDVILVAQGVNAGDNLHQHPLVEHVQLGTVQREPRGATLHGVTHVLELFRTQGPRPAEKFFHRHFRFFRHLAPSLRKCIGVVSLPCARHVAPSTETSVASGFTPIPPRAPGPSRQRRRAWPGRAARAAAAIRAAAWW
jgi:hypothetical protein